MGNVKQLGPNISAADIEQNDTNIDTDLQSFKSSTNTSIANIGATATSAQSQSSSAVATANAAQSTANTTQTNLNAHTSATSNAHTASAISETTYGDVQSAVTQTKSRIDNIVSSAGTSNTEIVDARNSTPNNTTYGTLKARLDAGDTATNTNATNITNTLATIAGNIQKAVNSGVIDYTANFLNGGGIPSNGQVQTLGTQYFTANAFCLGNSNTLINGALLNVNHFGVSPTVNYNQINLDAPPSSNVTPSLTGSARDDLVFLEAWQDAGGAGWKWRIRVVDGVDFGTYTEGLGTPSAATVNTGITTQAGNSAPVTYTGNQTFAVYMSPAERQQTSNVGHQYQANDTGLYIAGDGTTSSQAGLNSVDGYVYAIPLFRVRRRNSGAFDPDTNPLGGKQYYTATSASAITVVSGQSYTVNLQSAQTLIQVGDILTFNSGNGIIQVTAVNSATQIQATALTAGQNIGSGTAFTVRSDRPDGLYSNIIDASDIIDLRHQVSLTGFDKKALLNMAMRKLPAGQLTTNQQVRYGRDYIGLNTSAYTDDANTLLYLKFDGSMAGTANGSAVANTKQGSGTEGYGNGVQGLAGNFTAGNYCEQYPVSIGTTGEIAFAFKMPASGTPGTNIMLMAYGDNTATLRRFYIGTNSSLGITVGWYDSTGQTGLGSIVSSNGILQVGDPSWHSVRFTFNASGLSLYLDGVLVASNSTAPAWLSVSYVTVGSGSNGASSFTAYSFQGYIDLLRISNIVRTTDAFLPSTFSNKNGDRILDGPYGDFSFWSDDVGGTAGTGGRTNPYGLSRVPNQVAGRISYNGSEIRHYFGNGITAGFGGSANAGINPTGSFDVSGEYQIVSATQQTGDGTTTTFTFTPPTNSQGIFLCNTNVTNTFKINGSYVTPSSATLNANGSLTTVFATAPANGVSVQALFTFSQRHAHFVPSTKGFIIHDWTDSSFTGDGTTTAFTTPKKNVTSVNHVRVNGVIQNGGYTVANLNSTSSGATVTFTTAPASGATVDIVYESVLTPSLGDYIRVMYSHLPYQGLLGTAFAGSGKYSFEFVDEDDGFILTLGSGSNSTPNVPAWMKDYPVPSAQLPINGYDYQLKHDTITLSNNTVTNGSQQFVENEQMYEQQDSSAGNIYSPATTITPITQVNRGYSVAGLNDGVSGRVIDMALRDLGSAVPHVAGMAAIAQDTTSGELLLFVATALKTDATNRIQSSSSSTAIDVFKLPGRPLLKSYGGVSA